MERIKKMEYNCPLIYQRADPWAYKHTDGYYYFTGSIPTYDKIGIRRSKTINGLSDAEEHIIWHKHEQGHMGNHIWAPELHFLDGEFYIYFGAGDAEDKWALRPYILKCEGNDPINDPWRELGMIQRSDDDPASFSGFSLDATVLVRGDEKYYIWAEKVGFGSGLLVSNLYIAKMETPYKLATPGMLLTTPDYDWERVGFWVDEGPSVLIHGGKIYVAFSSSSTGACYCMGLMEADYDADLLDRNSWKKSRYPVLKTDESMGIYGPGHGSFTVAEDGETTLCFYHARPYEKIVGDPLYDPNRHTRVMEVKFDEDDRPVFDLKQ